MTQSLQVCNRGATAGCLWTTSLLFLDLLSRWTTKWIIFHSFFQDMKLFFFSFLYIYFCVYEASSSVSLLAAQGAWWMKCSNKTCLTGSPDYFWMQSHPQCSPLLTVYIIRGIENVPSAQWQGVIRKQLRKAFSFVCGGRWGERLGWCLRWWINNEANGLLWHCRSSIMNWSLGSQKLMMSGQQLRRLCPRNSLNHKHIGSTGHQLPLPQPHRNIFLPLLHSHFLRKKTQRCTKLESSIRHAYSGTKQRYFNEMRIPLLSL